MGGTVRTEKPEVEQEVKTQLERIVEFVPRAFGCEGKVRYTEVAAAVINHPEPATALRNAVGKLMGADALTDDMMGASEDFSFMSAKIPGAYMLVGHAVPGKEIIMNHNPHFDYNESLIPPCILAWIKLTEDRLGFSILK